MKTEIYKSAVLSHFLNRSKVIYYFKTKYYTGHRSYIILKPIIKLVIDHILFFNDLLLSDQQLF